MSPFVSGTTTLVKGHKCP